MKISKNNKNLARIGKALFCGSLGTLLLGALLSVTLVTNASAKNILFYGNSFTNGAGSTDSVPNLVRSIAVAAGQEAPAVFNAAVGGRDFTWHLSNNTSAITTGLPAGQQWDYAVLQNFSTAPTHLGNLAQHRSDSVAMYQAIATHSPSFTPVLFETWARGPGHDFYTTGPSQKFAAGPSQMQEEIRVGYQLAAQDIDAVAGAGTTRVASIGSAWEAGNWTNFHGGDIYHAQNRGTLLAALEIYSTVYQDDTRDINLTGVLDSLGLAANDGLVLASLVDGTTLSPPSHQAMSLKFDLGVGYHPGARYNLIPSNTQHIEDAIDHHTGLPTGVGVSLTSPTGFNEVLPNPLGARRPSGPASEHFDSISTKTNLIGHDSNFSSLGAPRPEVELTIEGLEPDRLYDFTFFGSHSNVLDNRETEYGVVGANSGIDWLDASNNSDGIAQVLGIQPNLNGEIVLTVQKGPNNDNSDGFFYLAAMEITAGETVPEPASAVIVMAGLFWLVAFSRLENRLTFFPLT